jgi:hypothetical protein
MNSVYAMYLCKHQKHEVRVSSQESDMQARVKCYVVNGILIGDQLLYVAFRISLISCYNSLLIVI